MASTFTIIGRQILGSSAASVSFASIPGTYTALLLIGQTRTDRASNAVDNVNFQFNADSGSNMLAKTLTGNGATVSVAPTAAAQKLSASSLATAATATTNAFASWEMIIPDYCGSNDKAIHIRNTHETNATTAFTTMISAVWRNAAAVTQIDITPVNGTNFVSGSTFHLYGITKA